MNEDLADFLAEAGTVVGGSAALFGTVGFLAAKLSRDFGLQDADPIRWAEDAAQWGALFGLAALAYRGAGVQ